MRRAGAGGEQQEEESSRRRSRVFRPELSLTRVRLRNEGACQAPLPMMHSDSSRTTRSQLAGLETRAHAVLTGTHNTPLPIMPRGFLSGQRVSRPTAG